MPDAHYENPQLAKLYDMDSPWSIDREFYLSLAGPPPQRILDLGCGTGLLCNAYAAKGHDVTGVDPSPAMLEVGRRKPHGKEIECVQSLRRYKKAWLSTKHEPQGQLLGQCSHRELLWHAQK